MPRSGSAGGLAPDDPPALDGASVRDRLDVLSRRSVPGYIDLVGPKADGITFFVGSIFFTAAGALQSSLAWPERKDSPAGRAAWLTAVIQSAGTLFFNVTTYQGMHTALTNPDYNKLVWRPDALGSGLLPRLRLHRLPRVRASRLAAEACRTGLVGAWHQPPRLHLLRHLGRRRLRRPVHRLDARPGRSQLEHRPRSRVLPRMRARHAQDRPDDESPALPPHPSARAPDRGAARVDRTDASSALG